MQEKMQDARLIDWIVPRFARGSGLVSAWVSHGFVFISSPKMAKAMPGQIEQASTVIVQGNRIYGKVTEWMK